MRRIILLTFLAALIFCAAQVASPRPAEAAEICEASWYGPGLYGNLTASGTLFYGQAGYAAHKYLPFGTEVLVTNLYTGQSAVLTINDRGPYIAGRCIDLSAGSAWLIGYGLAPVSVEVLVYS